ncbi:hypothetical protein ACFQZS_01770 [Mucilaginibacter calamicampi]|uniref:Uncharacterized protein n=1 Tax=Mucilaginibacter calamicampi TaxID=1302352 RepID=A0ABW2YWD0_9SPHI
MIYKDDEFLNDFEDQQEQNELTAHIEKPADNGTPNAYVVKDDAGVEEKNLQRSYLFGDAEMKPVREGQPMGGESFGENNVTPAGDDKNNPSQNAGYSNAYFGRTEPAEEHPENSNFTTDGENGHAEGTVDSDGAEQYGAPGPIEIPGKTDNDDDNVQRHIET